MTASEPQPAAPSPKLRWRQWTLWSMFLLTLLVAIACSWLAVKMEQARNQREVVEAIVEGHGWVATTTSSLRQVNFCQKLHRQNRLGCENCWGMISSRELLVPMLGRMPD